MSKDRDNYLAHISICMRLTRRNLSDGVFILKRFFESQDDKFSKNISSCLDDKLLGDPIEQRIIPFLKTLNTNDIPADAKDKLCAFFSVFREYADDVKHLNLDLTYGWMDSWVKSEIVNMIGNINCSAMLINPSLLIFCGQRLGFIDGIATIEQRKKLFNALCARADSEVGNDSLMLLILFFPHLDAKHKQDIFIKYILPRALDIFYVCSKSPALLAFRENELRDDFFSACTSWQRKKFLDALFSEYHKHCNDEEKAIAQPNANGSDDEGEDIRNHPTFAKRFFMAMHTILRHPTFSIDKSYIATQLLKLPFPANHDLQKKFLEWYNDILSPGIISEDSKKMMAVTLCSFLKKKEVEVERLISKVQDAVAAIQVAPDDDEAADAEETRAIAILNAQQDILSNIVIILLRIAKYIDVKERKIILNRIYNLEGEKRDNFFQFLAEVPLAPLAQLEVCRTLFENATPEWRLMFVEWFKNSLVNDRNPKALYLLANIYPLIEENLQAEIFNLIKERISEEFVSITEVTSHLVKLTTFISPELFKQTIISFFNPLAVDYPTSFLVKIIQANKERNYSVLIDKLTRFITDQNTDTKAYAVSFLVLLINNENRTRILTLVDPIIQGWIKPILSDDQKANGVTARFPSTDVLFFLFENLYRAAYPMSWGEIIYNLLDKVPSKDWDIGRYRFRIYEFLLQINPDSIPSDKLMMIANLLQTDKFTNVPTCTNEQWSNLLAPRFPSNKENPYFRSLSDEYAVNSFDNSHIVVLLKPIIVNFNQRECATFFRDDYFATLTGDFYHRRLMAHAYRCFTKLTGKELETLKAHFEFLNLKPVSHVLLSFFGDVQDTHPDLKATIEDDTMQNDSKVATVATLK